jgi:hypothetical protein
MGKLLVLIIVLIPSFIFSQNEELSDSIYSVLRGGKGNIPISRESNNENLRRLAIEIVKSDSCIYTNRGLHLVVFRATNLDYNSFSDSLFLDVLFHKFTIESIFDDGHYIRNNFKKSNYNNSALQKLSFYSRKQSVLFWKSWTPYYLSFLNIQDIDSTIIFLMNNIDDINHIYYRLNNIPRAFDTLDLKVCLARLGKLNDTLVINELDERLNTSSRYSHLYYFESLSRIRTPFAFQKIGNYLFSEDDRNVYDEDKIRIRQMALSAFIAYVENFPNRSTKRQDTFILWSLVRYSGSEVPNYSKDEYMEMAKQWYMLNKDNLILDMDKY